MPTVTLAKLKPGFKVDEKLATLTMDSVSRDYIGTHSEMRLKPPVTS